MYSPLLNVRSCFNFQDSLITIDEYLDFAKKEGFQFAIYNDIETLYGLADFVKAAEKRNLKPIVGITINFLIDNNSFSINFYAKNLQGYQTISKFSSMIMCHEFKNDIEKWDFILENINKNLIAVISFNNLFNHEIFKKLESKFESEKIFIGVNVNSNEIDYQFKSRVIFNQEIKYLDKRDFASFKILKAIKENIRINEQSEIQNNYFYYSDEELDVFLELDVHKKNINYIFENCNFNLFDNPQRHLIKYPNTKNIPSDNYLRLICEQSLTGYFKNFKKMPGIPQIYLERLEAELNTIFKMGFSDYFLVVYDFVRKAKELEILVGPGRGSAVGSLVSFLLQITTVDPLEYGLIFERFLNPERISLPDIDIDFQDDRRDEVIEYIFEKYGRFNVATITTYQTIGTKNALRDCARVFGITPDEINEITKPIGNEFLRDLDGAIEKFPKLKIFLKNNQQIYTVAKKIIGLPRQTGTHAAGLVFCDIDLRDVVPLKVGYNGINQTQFSMNYLEDLGLIKIDLLGLRNLTTLNNILKAVSRNRKINTSLSRIPVNDYPTFTSLQEGKTTGIFQLESGGMTDTIIKMKVSSINDIAAASALFRPGPQENIPEYIKRKNSGGKFEILDESLKTILEPTFGIIVYQEQVIQILQTVAGFSLAKADIVRRAMGKKDLQLMKKEQEDFVEGAISKGYTIEKAKQIWMWILKFANYGFNKSHAIAYSYIGYWLAYLKQNYTAEFYCELLNSAVGNDAKTAKYLEEARALGIKVIPPNVKNVNLNYFGNEVGIYLPLILVKQVGIEFIKNLAELKEIDKTAFLDLFNFCSKTFKRGLNKTTFSNLVKSGAMDIFGFTRETLLENQDKILLFADLNQNIEKINPFTFPQLEIKPDSEIKKSFYELDSLGFYFTSHPLQIIRNQLANSDRLSFIKDLTKPEMKSPILFVINDFRIHLDKNNNEMVFLDVSDETGHIDITIFSSVYNKFKDQLNQGDILIGEIKTQLYNGKISGVLNQVLKSFATT
ncbi:DNA polymerase III subunit alpha [Spiroplasma alleghenense]|uniref:DNA-directed DNA polymerase n=1 Tax=Spiroplasma alleghenense TaxID=216931 RepID=A0A345Z451_9MOLU|nr:DNA polymerase III subunit alpha [Spiroplasma alleghenense]AXK51380.1 DNA polymerase III subunit alpha [Spiroplasma alleghenense]